MAFKIGDVVRFKNGDGPYNVARVTDYAEETGKQLVHLFWTDKNHTPQEVKVHEDMLRAKDEELRL